MQMDYAVVAPDDPLVLGCGGQRSKSLGIPCFGPRKNGRR